MTIALTTHTPSGRSGLRPAVRAEWTKLTSLRSTPWTIGAMALGSIVVTYLSCLHARHHSAVWYQGFDPTNQAMSGLFVASLLIGVLGALAVTGEYSSGSIRTSLAALPRRQTFLGAKAVVVGGVALVVGELLSFACFFVGRAVLSGAAPTASLGQPGVLRAVVLSGAFLALLALFGLGLGTALRHTAGAVASYAGALLLVTVLLDRFSPSAARFAPEQIYANSVAAVVPQANSLSATIGFMVMVAYAAAALCLGGAALVRRDA
jgi:ABC-2 type transport system permease protein